MLGMESYPSGKLPPSKTPTCLLPASTLFLFHYPGVAPLHRLNYSGVPVPLFPLSSSQYLTV